MWIAVCHRKNDILWGDEALWDEGGTVRDNSNYDCICSWMEEKWGQSLTLYP
jgi:hypothetical protein